MALTGKYTTIYDVIERTRRSGINDFTEEEAKEWAWEAISLMGVPSHYISKVAILKVENARAELPYDLYDISEGGVRDYYTKRPLLKECNLFHNPETVGEQITPLLYENIGESVVFIDGIPQTDTDSYLAQITYIDYAAEKRTYRINNNFIETGFKSGLIEMAYKAFPVDNEGNPLIEDSFKVIRAVMSYIKRMVMTRMFFRDEVSLQKYEIISREAMFHMSSAKSDASIGSVDDWEAVRSMAMRLRRDPNLQRIGFDGLSSRENLNLG